MKIRLGDGEGRKKKILIEVKAVNLKWRIQQQAGTGRGRSSGAAETNKPIALVSGSKTLMDWTTRSLSGPIMFVCVEST